VSNIWRGYFYRVSINPFQFRSSSWLFDASPHASTDENTT